MAAGGGGGRVWRLGVPAVSAGLALWLVRGLWGSDPVGGLDTMAHLVRTDFGLREVFGRGHLDGWAPTPGVGSEIFLHYGPGLALLTGAMRLVTFGLPSNPGAFKVLLAASFAATPLAVGYLARSFGLGQPAAAVAGLLSLAVSSRFGPGIEGVFGEGLVPHQVAAPIALLALGALVRLWLDPGRQRVVPLAASGAVLVLVHPISAVIVAVLGGVLVVLMEGERLAARHRSGHSTAPVTSRGWGPVVGLAGAGVLAGGLAAFWLVPFLAHQDLGGAAGGWATPPFGTRIDQVLAGEVLFRPRVAWFMVAGMVGALVVRPGRRPVAMVLAPLAYLAVAHAAHTHFPFNQLAFQLANRGMGYAGLVAVLPLAAVITCAVEQIWRRRTWPEGVAAAVACGVAAAVAVWPMAPLAQLSPGSRPTAAAAEAAEVLRRLVPPQGRFAVQRQPFEREATGLDSPPFWLALASGRTTVNAFAPEASTAPVPMFVGDSLAEGPVEEAADRLARYGVTHLVLTAPDGTGRFITSSRFRVEWASPQLTVLTVLPAVERPQPSSLVFTAGPATATYLGGGPEHPRVRVRAEERVGATLAIAWSPKWTARLDGRPVDLGRTDLGLLQLELPAGEHTLELTFGRDVWDRLGGAVTAATLLALAVVVIRRRRRPVGYGAAGGRRRPSLEGTTVTGKG